MDLSTPPKIWQLAWPTIIANLLLAGVGLVQVILATYISTDAIAAMTIVQRFFFILQAALFGLAIGVSAVIAKSIGANAIEKAGQAAQSALLLGFVITSIISVLCFVIAPWVTLWFELPESIHATTINMIRWICLFSPIYSLNIIFTSCLRASGDAISPLYLAFIAFSGNVLGSIALSKGWFGLPAMGVEGIVIGAIVGSIFAIVMCLYQWKKGRYILRYPITSNHRKKLALLLKVGLPSAYEQCIIQLGFLVFTIAVAQYGQDALAAYGLGVNILSLIIIIALALSTSGAIIVGQYIGAQQPELAYQQGWRSWRVSMLFLLCSAAVLMAFAANIAQALASAPEVIGLTTLFLFIVAISLPFLATDFALGGAIRGAGDTRFPLYVTLCTLILVRFVLPFVCIYYGFSITVLFALTALDFGVKAIFMLWYFRKKTWLNKMPISTTSTSSTTP